MKELSEFAMRRRVARGRMNERDAKIKVAQDEYRQSSSTRHKRALLQYIDKLANQSFDTC